MAKLFAGLFGARGKAAARAGEDYSNSRHGLYSPPLGYLVTASGTEWHRDREGNFHPLKVNPDHSEQESAVRDLLNFLGVCGMTTTGVDQQSRIELAVSFLQAGMGISVKLFHESGYCKEQQTAGRAERGTDKQPAERKTSDTGRQGNDGRGGLEPIDPPAENLIPASHAKENAKATMGEQAPFEPTVFEVDDIPQFLRAIGHVMCTPTKLKTYRGEYEVEAVSAENGFKLKLKRVDSSTILGVVRVHEVVGILDLNKMLESRETVGKVPRFKQADCWLENGELRFLVAETGLLSTPKKGGAK